MGLLKTAAKVAVASHVHGRVQRRQSQRWAAQDAAVAPAPVAQQVGPAQVARPAAEAVLAQLAQLGDLRKEGVLTQAEFEIQKARILGQ